MSPGPRGGRDCSLGPPKSYSSELRPRFVPGSTAGQAEMEVSAPDSKPLKKAGRAKNNTTNAIKGLVEEVEMT